jgi:hypothetical protein
MHRKTAEPLKGNSARAAYLLNVFFQQQAEIFEGLVEDFVSVVLFPP